MCKLPQRMQSDDPLMVVEDEDGHQLVTTGRVVAWDDEVAGWSDISVSEDIPSFYFEVTIMNRSPDGSIAVGFFPVGKKMLGFPGQTRTPGSVGMFDNGYWQADRVSHDIAWPPGSADSSRFWADGDVVGFLHNRLTGFVSVTHNGTIKEDIVCLPSHRKYHPGVCVGAAGVRLYVNFGQKPFRFDFAKSKFVPASLGGTMSTDTVDDEEEEEEEADVPAAAASAKTGASSSSSVLLLRVRTGGAGCDAVTVVAVRHAWRCGYSEPGGETATSQRRGQSGAAVGLLPSLPACGDNESTAAPEGDPSISAATGCNGRHWRCHEDAESERSAGRSGHETAAPRPRTIAGHTTRGNTRDGHEGGARTQRNERAARPHGRRIKPIGDWRLEIGARLRCECVGSKYSTNTSRRERRCEQKYRLTRSRSSTSKSAACTNARCSGASGLAETVSVKMVFIARLKND